MKKTAKLLALSCVIVSACRSDGVDGGDTDNKTTVRVLPSNVEVMAKAYDPAYQTPEDFYVDERAGTEGSYSLYHVKDQSLSYELCTDVYDIAYAWEDADNAIRPVNGNFITSVENSRYFEFVRELSYPDGVGNIPGSTSPGFARVFKCSYVNRDGVDRNLHNGFAGRLNTRPLSESAIRNYAEYMWQFSFFWPARQKVLDAYSGETPGSYEHTLLLALVTNQGNGHCDLIEVVDWEFSVDKSSGEIERSLLPVFQLEAEFVDGSIRECVD